MMDFSFAELLLVRLYIAVNFDTRHSLPQTTRPKRRRINLRIILDKKSFYWIGITRMIQCLCNRCAG